MHLILAETGGGILGFVAKTVDLDRLGELLDGYGFAFFITVGDDHRIRTTAVTPVYRTGVFDVGVVGRHGRANLADRRGVTLVFPARDVRDYSLLIDGDAAVPDDPSRPVLVTPTRALLHRPILHDGRQAAGGAYDCVQLTQG